MRASPIALALLVATPALAQVDRNIPMGNPLGNVPIAGADRSAPVVEGPDGPGELLRRQQEVAARIQALNAYRARQAALAESARPLNPPGGYVDYGRLGDEQRARQQQTADAGRQPPRGPIPSPFGSGVPSPFAGGIRAAWDRR